MKKIQIFPTPIQRIDLTGLFTKPLRWVCAVAPDIDRDFRERGVDPASFLPVLSASDAKESRLIIREEEGLKKESYRLRICPEEIQIFCAASAGAYYAMQTLRQIFSQAEREVPCMEIYDGPQLEIRGVLLDIGRDKIPTMKTLRTVIDLLSCMKVNHLELYLEGYCFEWQQYRYLFPDETPVTAEEFRELARYARQHFIDLVPNQNCLGHMDQWLAKPQFRGLAECEDGFLFQNLYRRAPGTIDVKDPRAFSMVTGMYGELLQNFTSEYVNANLDEPFELGMGKNRAAGSSEKLYTNYVKEMHSWFRSHGKKMMMWGDVIFSHPECIADLPEDVTVLDWIYEGAGSFEKDCRTISETGLSYCLCPGTSSWCSFTGRSENMKENIKNAAFCAADYGAKGIILTDWGDLGHWQYLSTSYVPFAFSAGYAWSGRNLREKEAFDYCDREIYRDAEGQASRTAYALGNYYRFEHAPLFNTTLCFAVMASKYRFDTKEQFRDKLKMMLTISRNIAKGLDIEIQDPEIRLDADGLKRYLEEMTDRASALKLGCEDGALIRKEMALSARMTLHGLSLYRAMTEHESDEHQFTQDMHFLFDDIDGIMQKHWELWNARNREGGLSKSMEQMDHLMNVYAKYL